MLVSRNPRGAKHRFLIFMYLTCFILSLTPTISAPPERGFNQGQPEMHQSMDNMVAHGVVMKKTGMTFPTSDGTGFPAQLTAKTSKLLDEAERVLSSLKDSKEKQWVSAFVQRMRAIADMLEKTAEKSKLPLPEKHNSEIGTPVPEGLPSQPIWTAATAVPGSNPFQKSSKMMPKFSVTSPELSQVLPVNESPSERLVVTTATAVLNKQDDEDDELVRELKNLHKEVAFEVPVQNSKLLDMTPVFTSPEPLSTEGIEEAQLNKEKVKAKLREKLLGEMAEYQRLGGISNEIVNALNEDKHIPTDSIPTQSKEAQRVKDMDTGLSSKTATSEIKEVKIEEKEISSSNPESFKLKKNEMNQGGNQFQQMKANYPYMPSFPRSVNQFQRMPPQSNWQPYQRGFNYGNYGAGNWHKPNPFYFHGNYQAMGSTNQQLANIPTAFRQRMPLPQDMVYNGPTANHDYNQYLAKNRYGTYPHMQQWQNKNSTLNLQPGGPPFLPKPPMNHKIDTQLNDEMKRQLRDGKIVVLSDSLVRTNFKPDETFEEQNSSIKQPDLKDGKKNGTQTPN